jgi:inner membrane protein
MTAAPQLPFTSRGAIMTDTNPFAEPPGEAPPPVDAPPPAPPQRAGALSMAKMALVAGLALATVLPSLFISNLIDEREQRQATVQKEFARNWGPEQSLYAPVLIVPYQWAPDRPRQYLKIATAKLDLAATLDPQERRRGLFHAIVYDVKVDMQGAFAIPPEAKLRDFISDKESRFLWNEAFVAFGTATSFAGLRNSDTITINNTETPWLPCREMGRHEKACNGALVLAAAPLDPVNTQTRLTFKSSVTLRGTSAFSVVYGGKELDATVRSPWPSPSFNGDVLPVSSTVSADGFEAKWQIVEFGSPRVATSPVIVDPEIWKGRAVSVDLIEATPIYRMISRVAKYALLFVVLSFATYVFFELLARLNIHIVQYGLLGLSLSLFSLLLLSLSEPIGYTQGYLVASGLVLAQSTLYTAAVTRRFRQTAAFAAMLSSLFAFLYVLLGLETYSLLIGALALFAVVSALMVVTQWVSWTGGDPAEAPA